MHFWVFLKVKVQNGGYFLRCLKFPLFFGLTVDAGPEP